MSMALNTANLMELTDVTARPILPLKSHDHWGKVSGAWKINKKTHHTSFPRSRSILWRTTGQSTLSTIPSKTMEQTLHVAECSFQKDNSVTQNTGLTHLYSCSE